jgi:hypothetical protein
MIYFNIKTKQWVTRIKRTYLTFEFRMNRIALPVYFAQHWSGFKKEKHNTTTYISLFCLHFGIGPVGPIITDAEFPWR